MMSPMKLSRRLSPSRLSRSSARPRFLIAVIGLLVVIQLFLFLQRKTQYQSSWTWSSNKPSYDAGECSGITGLERVVITVDTGATEILEKIPTQLRTSLRCAPKVILFSDMEQMIEGNQVYDALDAIPAEVKDGNSDFDIYRKQKLLHDDPEKISSIFRDFKTPGNPDDSAAWTLDKYKKLHIVEKAWALHPDMDWYLHIEADTYLMLPTLAAWLKRLDSSKESFLGSVSLINEIPFAHGGSGTLLSNAAMRNFVVDHSGTAAQWDSKMQDECCGDFVLGVALKGYGMDLKNSWPTINGENPDTIPYASNHWCQPLVTMHHVTPAEAERLGEFEQRRPNKNSPVVFAEIFKDLIFDRIPDSKEYWDNQGKDETIPDIESAASCTEACANNPKCFQSVYNGEECTLGTKNFQFGKERKSEGDGKKWQSSWNKTRIVEWVTKQEPCSKVTFPFQESRWWP